MSSALRPLLAAAACVAAGCQLTSDREPERPPNIVVILADDLGIGDPGCYNPASLIATPSFDRLAAEGARFTDVHSPSAVCTPTRYGLLTGRYAWRGRLKSGVGWGHSAAFIEEGRPTLASMLAERGYRTGGFGKWHLGLGSAEKTDYAQPLRPGPVSAGFERYFGIPASLDMHPYVWIDDEGLEAQPTDETPGSEHRRRGGGGFWRAGPMAPGFEFDQVLPRSVDKAIEWIQEVAPREDGDAPFFVYLPLSAPHTPWLPTESFQGATEVAHYGDFVAQVDFEVGRVLATLDELGLTDDTLVVMTSDNGSHWPDADIEQHGHDANLAYRGQKADIFEGGHRVPFLVRWPGRVPAGLVRDDLGTLTDLYATIAEATGDGALPADAAEDSFSLLPAMTGAELIAPIRDHAVHHSLNGHFALRVGRWKYMPRLGSGGFTKPGKIEPGPGDPEGMLFDLWEDPGETTNLWAKRPDVVAEMAARLAALRADGRSRPTMP